MTAQITQIGNCARIINGIAFKSDLFTTIRNGLPVIRIRDVLRGHSETFFTGDYPPEALVNNGDLLVGMDGEFNISFWRGGPALLNQRVCKIEPKEGVADIFYLRHALAIVLKRIEDRTPFSTVKHLSSEELKEEIIRLPYIVEQRRIAERFEEAGHLCHMRRYALQMCDELLPAAFLEMFGDYRTNPADYATKPVSEICDLVRGSSPRPQGDPRFFGGPVPRLMISDITRDGVFVRPKIDSLTTEGAARSRPMPAGSVVMAVSANVGLPAILMCDACIHDGFVGFRNLSKSLSPLFFYYHLLFRKAASLGQAAGAIWQNITTDQIAEWEIPTPSMGEQSRWQTVVEKHARLRATHVEAVRQTDHLFQTLLHQAFNAQ